MRTRSLVLFTVVLAVSGLVAAVATAKPIAASKTYSATLNIAQEVPKETGAPANAGGTFSGTLTGKTLKWKLVFSHLTGAASAAHIHLAAKGKAGPVLIALCGPCKSPVSGSTKVTSAQIGDLNRGKMYVNVHTAKNPNGEIRGQIS